MPVEQTPCPRTQAPNAVEFALAWVTTANEGGKKQRQWR